MADTDPQLHEQTGDADQFDAANRSLADALNLSFRVLRWVFVLLLAIFLLSGIFTVKQNEVAVRTSFGRIVGGANGEVLTADGGPYFRWPRPIGEVIKVPTTEQTLYLTDDFVFRYRNPAADRDRRLSDLDLVAQLDPAADGFLVTGDRNIVHARYEVRYAVQPADAADFVRNAAGPTNADDFDDLADRPELLFERANEIVRRAVKEAIVADVAASDIDSFLRNSRGVAVAAPTDPVLPPAPTEGEDAAPADDAAPASPADAAATPADADPAAPNVKSEDAIMAAAQRVLDSLNTGITIRLVQRSDHTVPPPLRDYFERLNSNKQLQQQLRSDGATRRQQILTEAAGAAFPAVLAAIDVYEAADRQLQTSPDDAELTAAYEQADNALRDLLSGQPVGQVLPRLAETLPAEDPRRDRLLTLATEMQGATVSGSAYNILQEARREETEIYRQTQAELELFQRLLPDYRRNPEQFKRQLFFATLREVFSDEGLALETVRGRDGDVVRVELGEDPDREALDEQRALDERNNARQGGAPRQ